MWSLFVFFFFFSSRRRHTRCSRDWSSDVCSSNLTCLGLEGASLAPRQPAHHRHQRPVVPGRMIPDTSGNDLRPADLWGSFLDPTLTGRRGTSGNLPCHLAHFFVNEAVRCKNDRRAQLVWCSFEVADLAASFFNEQNARGDVPLVEAEFPEAVEAPGGHAGQIEIGRAHV